MNDGYLRYLSNRMPFKQNFLKSERRNPGYKFRGNLDKDLNGYGTFTCEKECNGVTTHSGEIKNGYFDGPSTITHKYDGESFNIKCNFKKGQLHGKCDMHYQFELWEWTYHFEYDNGNFVEKWWAESPIGVKIERNGYIRLQQGLEAIFALPLILKEPFTGTLEFEADRKEFKFTFVNGYANGAASQKHYEERLESNYKNGLLDGEQIGYTSRNLDKEKIATKEFFDNGVMLYGLENGYDSVFESWYNQKEKRVLSLYTYAGEQKVKILDEESELATEEDVQKIDIQFRQNVPHTVNQKRERLQKVVEKLKAVNKQHLALAQQLKCALSQTQEIMVFQQLKEQ